jgi:hypothetical protein
VTLRAVRAALGVEAVELVIAERLIQRADDAIVDRLDVAGVVERADPTGGVSVSEAARRLLIR